MFEHNSVGFLLFFFIYCILLGGSKRNLFFLFFVFRKCYNNDGIYSVFGLDGTYHVQGVMEKRMADLNALPAVAHIVDDATRRIKATKFLSATDRAALLDLAQSPWINQISLTSLKQQVCVYDLFSTFGPGRNLLDKNLNFFFQSSRRLRFCADQWMQLSMGRNSLSRCYR